MTRPESLCPWCGYSMVGLLDRDACPECGRNTHADREWAEAQLWVKARRVWWHVILLVGAGLAGAVYAALVAMKQDTRLAVALALMIAFNYLAGLWRSFAALTLTGAFAMLIGGLFGCIGLLVSPTSGSALLIAGVIFAGAFLAGTAGCFVRAWAVRTL